METYQIVIAAFLIGFASIGFAKTVELVVSLLKTTSKHEIDTLTNVKVIMHGKAEFIPTDAPYEKLYNEIAKTDILTLRGDYGIIYDLTRKIPYEDCLKQMIFNGAKYKRKLDALPKIDEVELRKYCFEKSANYPCYERLARAEVLYTYILTGKSGEKPKSNKGESKS